MGIKAIFSDMDGTLLVDNFSTTRENILAIERAAAAGICFVPATGRALGDIPRQILDIRGLKYMILANGAMVYDVVNKKIIFDDYMDKQKVINLLSCEQLKDACYFAMINGLSHYQKSMFENVKGTPIYGVLNEFLNYNIVLDEDLFDAVCKEENRVEKLVIYFRDSEHMFNAVNALPQLLDFDCANSFINNIELTKKGISKAHGIGFLCDMLNIKAEETVTIGDSGNDVGMLSFTKNSYAVANAMPAAKKAARHQAPSNLENAVAFVIKKYL